jgi:hypothetical protein
MKIKIYTYLKNTDLHCFTAFEAITQLLKYDKLQKLSRYTAWEVELNEETNDEVIKTIEKIIDNSYYILNPNKEEYYMEKLPEPKSKEHQLILTVPNSALDEDGLIKKIQQKVGVTVKSIKKALIWELTTIVPVEEIKEELMQKVVYCNSRNGGVLVNPVNQKVSISQ